MRYFIEISYDGTAYSGWQSQSNARSVQEEIEAAITKITGDKVAVSGSSRTDAGVHARQQYAHFDREGFEPFQKKWASRLNSVLPSDIAIKSILLVDRETHARFAAEGRKYIYRFSKNKNPFSRNFSTLFFNKLNLSEMNRAAEVLLRYEDFEAFSKVKTDVKTFNCKIAEARWAESPDGYEFHIQANRFLRGMVRAVVGSMVRVGLGVWSVKDFENVILSKDRRLAGAAAKAQGLTLERVIYSEESLKLPVIYRKIEPQDYEKGKMLMMDYQDFIGFSLCFQGFESELEQFPKPYHEPDGVMLVADLYGEIVGMAALKPLNDHEAEMKRLFVKPEVQGLNIGKTLVEKVLDEAKNKSYKKVKLDTLPTMEKAISLYRSVGFESCDAYHTAGKDSTLYFEKTINFFA